MIVILGEFLRRVEVGLSEVGAGRNGEDAVRERRIYYRLVLVVIHVEKRIHCSYLYPPPPIHTTASCLFPFSQIIWALDILLALVPVGRSSFENVLLDM